MAKQNKQPDTNRLDRVVESAIRARTERESGYRERALKIYPWICGRCAREFQRENLQMLTVHHRDHNHDNNPPDGSNWELLCIYCHENEHARQLDQAGREITAQDDSGKATFKGLAGLAGLLKRTDD